MKILHSVCLSIHKSDLCIKEKTKIMLSQENRRSRAAGEFKLKSTGLLHLCTMQEKA